MDHLPSAYSDKASISPTVPCLALEFTFQYPRQPQGIEGFLQFPSQHGYELKVLVDRASSDRKICSFLQSWLFFGLLTETFARPNYSLERDDFIQSDNDGDSVITTKALPRYLWYWLAARTHEYREDMIELEKTVDDCLRLAHSILHSINQQRRQSSSCEGTKTEWTVEARILLSLSLLGDYLTFARGQLKQYTTTTPLYWESAFLDEVMIDAGWCIGELSTLRDECNLSSRYYLSTMNRKSLGKNHEKCSSGITCHANQLDYRTYETRHAPDCADPVGCEEIGPPVEDLVRAIEQGGCALVETHGSRPPGVIQYGGTGGREMPYVAISHVWSDGRGNPWRNCLRLCQLQHIQNLVNNLYEPEHWPVPFWMDTLCIPVGREHTKSRRAAIIRIAQTFRKADKVLVVDRSLQLCSTDSSWVEKLMHIQYSPWMTRLWTYLECRVSRNLYFQLGNEAIFSENLEDQLVQYKRLVEISNTLRKLPEERLDSSPSAIQLVRAISSAKPSEQTALYSLMPPQSDPVAEELRQGALNLLEARKEYYALGDIWQQFLGKLGHLNDLDDDNDDMVRVDIEVYNVCPVTKHAHNSVASMRGKLAGLVFEQLTDMPDIQTTRQGNTIARLFDEISNGLRARTTSWLDDETVCLGALLGVDLAKIQEIQPMGWWWRKRLDRIDCQKSRYPLARKLGISFSRWTEACQRQRMKCFLAQIQDFPLSIIFWNAPRLGSKQWTWAPRSLMHRNLGSEYSFVLGTGKLGSAGLEVITTAYKLSSSPHQNITRFRSKPRRGNNPRPSKFFHNFYSLVIADKSSAKNAIIIRPAKPTPPEALRYAWLHVEFLPDDKTITSSSESRRTWQDYIDSGIIDNLAIIYQSNFGILVQIYNIHHETYLVRHVRLVRPATGSREDNIPTASGTWMNRRGVWCIA
ncbi:hypothetical protein F5B20DRAFT_207945 [Whalleya microplaca]|nr:hypothetical protein F5B20DRAFT_207945 [Whalleya microplaca]